MSVESYLDSIRKNTVNTSNKTASLNNTMKDLLNYESLKKAVSDGVEEGNKEQFKKLAELSKKILTTSDATTAELKEVNQLLKLFYSQLPKTSSGTTQVSAESWIRALKEVLDEFGDLLPLKFQNRLRNDIVATAADAGANPQVVMQQLNMTQVNQTVILQNIYDEMIERQKLVDRQAEARKPIENQEKKDQATFWQTSLGKVINTLTSILSGISKAGAWLGLIYVGLGVWSQLKENVREMVQGVASTNFLFRSGKFLSGLFRETGFGKLFSDLGKRFSDSRFMQNTRNALQNVGGAAKQGVASTLLNTKAGNAILGVITNPTINKALKGIQGFFKSIGKLAVGPLGKIGGVVLKAVSKATPWVIAISSIYDFIEGFINTKGNIGDKIIGGLKNLIYKFFQSLAAIPNLIIKGLFKAWDWVAAYFKKGLPAIAKDIYDGFLFMLKNILSVFTIPMATLLGEMITRLEKDHPVIAGLLSKAKGMLEKMTPESPIAGKSLFNGLGFSDSATSTVYMNQDAISATMPLSSHIAGIDPANASGINTAAGVNMSSQTADFYKRAGLTDVVTSGIRDPGIRDIKNGKISQRSHASGNKFDIAGRNANGTLKSAQQLADTLGKMIRTPGLLEAHVEGPETKEWYGTYLSALQILKRQGLDTSKVGWWGSKYSNQPHIDVLIDPKYSGVQTANNLTSTVSTLDGASGDSKTVNPLVADMTANLTKAFNEQIKLFESGAKAPDQLASSQNKAAVSAITGQFAASMNTGGVTFNKQNDINDANLLAYQFFNLG